MFYVLTLVTMYLVWLILSIIVGTDFHAANAGKATVLLRPSWCPPQVLCFLHRPGIRTVARHLPVAGLTAATFLPENVGCRMFAAVSLSVYSLVDTSATHSHRDYANLYCSWLLAVASPDVARAGALGVCVHYIASSGFAKLYISGSPRAWCDSATLGAVLETYSKVRKCCCRCFFLTPLLDHCNCLCQVNHRHHRTDASHFWIAPCLLMCGSSACETLGLARST